MQPVLSVNIHNRTLTNYRITGADEKSDQAVYASAKDNHFIELRTKEKSFEFNVLDFGEFLYASMILKKETRIDGNYCSKFEYDFAGNHAVRFIVSDDKGLKTLTLSVIQFVNISNWWCDAVTELAKINPATHIIDCQRYALAISSAKLFAAFLNETDWKEEDVKFDFQNQRMTHKDGSTISYVPREPFHKSNPTQTTKDLPETPRARIRPRIKVRA